MSGQVRLGFLVGIDRYPNFGPRSQLRSCASDARLMAEVLRDRFDFAEEDLMLLLDEAATRDGILDGLAALRSRARPGDAVVFFYSGHGSQVTDREGDEPDLWDESIVPHDGGRGKHAFRDITDDEIYLWVLALSAVTPNLAVIVDTCFAGTMTREGPGLPAPREKWVEPETRTAAELPPSPVPEDLHRNLPRDIEPAGFLPVDERYVLFAACRAGEHAKELPAAPGVRPQSVFTFYLCRELRRARHDATWRDLLEPVRAAVAAVNLEQVPQLEGARDRRLFGLTTRTPSTAGGPAWLNAVAGEPDGAARYRRLLEVEDEDPGNPLCRCLEVEFLCERSEGQFQPVHPDSASGEIVYQDGDRFALRIIHHHQRPLYIHVVYLESGGGVEVLHPVAGANDPLTPERELLVGVRKGDGLFARLGPSAGAGEDEVQESTEARDVVKVFATTHEADLGWLEQPDSGSSRDDERWTVVTRSLLIRRSGAEGSRAGSHLCRTSGVRADNERSREENLNASCAS